MRRKTGPKKIEGPGSHKAKKTVAGMLDGKTMEQAARDAGYSAQFARKAIYSKPVGDWIKTEVHRRMNEAMSKAAVHTDAITGSLVEVMMASPADILPDHPILVRARQNGVDHLIKKITITPIKLGMKEFIRQGKVVSQPVIGERIDLEMYSRLDAISQLRDNFGMKQEPRANTYEAERRQEVERSLKRIMEADKVDRPTAAKRLAEAVGEDSPLIPTINKAAAADSVH